MKFTIIRCSGWDFVAQLLNSRSRREAIASLSALFIILLEVVPNTLLSNSLFRTATQSFKMVHPPLCKLLLNYKKCKLLLDAAFC